jgi:c-di-AMP phosphodiesterase-like protein
MNDFFKKEKIKGKAIHLSLFELEKVINIIKKTKKPRIVLLFKTIDSLEMLKKDYSKKLISEISPFVDKIVISFATESMIKREKFKVKRKWLVDFIKGNFQILNDFEINGERYIVFSEK